MSRWFRHYAGMMRDDKLVRVAIRSKQTIERVAWVWGAILESAAEIDDDGRYDLDAAEAAYFLRADEDDVVGILRELEVAGRTAEGCVVKWGNRQFQSDRSAERVARHREKKRQDSVDNYLGNGGVTLQERRCNSPETETETKRVEASASTAREPAQPIVEGLECWNEIAVAAGWPTVAKLNDTRRRSLAARLREHGIDGWRTAIGRAHASPYLGRDPPSWFTFDWLLKPTNFLKVIEGNYDRRNETNRGGNGRMGGPRPDPTLALVRAAVAAQRPDDRDHRDAGPSLSPRQLGGP